MKTKRRIETEALLESQLDTLTADNWELLTSELRGAWDVVDAAESDYGGPDCCKVCDALCSYELEGNGK